MFVIMQINVTANWGSTGRIADLCCEYASFEGMKCYEIYGRYRNPSNITQIKVGNSFCVYEHYIESRLFDNEGLASRVATLSLIKKIKKLKPDLIHLHNIHDHWLNYKILFEYLNKTNIKIVWTFHDFWAITGHCTHFINVGCTKFLFECEDCPYTKGHFLPILQRARKNFRLKRKLFSANQNLTIVPVSEWVRDIVQKSFLKSHEIRVITNGVDTNFFKPTSLENISIDEKERLVGKFVIMAVSSQWKSGDKGLDDYVAMSKMLQEDEVIVLVGVGSEVSKHFPKNMIGVKRTNNQKELAALYTRADVVCSFSKAETFGLTIVEGYACGAPAVVYDNTALSSLITPETGFVVPNRDYKEAYDAIVKIRKKSRKYYQKACVELVESKYSKEVCFGKYIALYKELLQKNN